MTVQTLLSDADIERIARGFMDRTLGKAEWTHAAHFGSVLWLIRRGSHSPLELHLPGLIRAYNVSVGGVNSDSEGYHETITQASLRAARRVMIGHAPATPLSRILGALMSGPLGRSDWILTYWSRDLLFSVPARRGWVEPDLQRLPF